jgi:hypothetical protein
MTKLTSKYSVMTPSGFQNFDGILKKSSETIKFIFDDTSTFVCSLNHIFVIDNINIIADSINIFDKMFNKTVVDIIDIGLQDVYDLLEVQGDNTYITSGLISHNCRFLGVAGTLISHRKLSILAIGKPIIKQHDDAFLIYEEPTKEGVYVCCCDVGEGVGRDSSTIQVIDISRPPYRQVARYKSNMIKPNQFHRPIFKIATYYNESLVIVENNTIGKETLNNLFLESEYENIFFDDDFGMRTTRGQKNIGVSELKSLVEEDQLILCDYDTIAELSWFKQYPNKTWAAEKSKSDDLVMPLVTFGFFTQNNKLFELWFDRNDNNEINKNMIDQIEESLLPAGWHNTGLGFESMDVNANDEWDSF